MFAKTQEQFIIDAKKIHGDKYDYSKVEYINSRTPIIIICPIHGEFTQKPYLHLQGKGCKRCNFSHLERITNAMLTNLNVEYIIQYTNSKIIGNQSLDFYIPKYRIAIECQGGQHFDSVEYFGGSEGLKRRIELDTIKYQKCIQNGIQLIYLIEEKYNKQGLFESDEFQNIYTPSNTFTSIEKLKEYLCQKS